MKKLLFITSLTSLTISLCGCNNLKTLKEGSENLIISSNKSFAYSEQISVEDFLIKNQDNVVIPSEEIEISGFDAYTIGQQRVKFLNKNTKDYGFFDITLKSIDHKKVLLISNSHGEDLMRYSYEIAQGSGLSDFKFVNLYMAGAQMGMHWNNIQQDFNGYQYQEYNGGDAVITREVTARYAVEKENWDFIILQQLSSLSRKPSFVSDMDKIINWCKLHCSNNDVKFLYNMPFAYADMGGDSALSTFWDNDPQKMYENIAQVTRDNVATNKNIEAIIPTGTTAQNASTSSLGVNGIHRDSLHMNEIGRFIIGHTLVSKVFGVAPDAMTYKGEFAHCFDLAIESTANALAYPYQVTQATFNV